MAKYTGKIAFKGLLDMDNAEIQEEDKDGVHTYDLLAALKRFDGRVVAISISEESPVEKKQG